MRVASVSATSLIVSLTGTAAMAPSPARACAMTASMTAAVHERPGAVMDQHHPAFGTQRSQPRRHRVGPFPAPGNHDESLTHDVT